MDITRRGFIKLGLGGVAGGLILSGAGGLVKAFAFDSAHTAAEPANLSVKDSHYWRFVVNIHKCIGCGSCARACKKENNVPLEPETNRTWIERYVVDQQEKIYVDSPNAGYDGFSAPQMNTKYKNLDIRKSFFVPKLCNQCDKPPCVGVCPVGATYSTKEGVILINRNACIGCRYCIQACPYGARFFDRRYKVVDKCTWCYHRTTNGQLPACVEVCPTGARMFGDIRDPDSTVSKAIKNESIGVLKPDLGTDSKVYYIGLESGVH